MMGKDSAAGQGLFSQEWRALTPGEVALCRSVFPDPLPYEGIRLIDGPRANDFAEAAFRNRNTAITLRRTIYFGTRWCGDFSCADDEGRRLFLHEMTHVWQWRRLGVVGFLVRYGRDFLSCRCNAAAMYRYERDELPFGASRLEAQAEMVGDYQRAAGPHRALIERKLGGTGFYGL
jgi:hypothetical protein